MWLEIRSNDIMTRSIECPRQRQALGHAHPSNEDGFGAEPSRPPYAPAGGVGSLEPL